MAKYLIVHNDQIIDSFEADGAKEAKHILDIFRIEEPELKLFVSVKEDVVVDKAD